MRAQRVPGAGGFYLALRSSTETRGRRGPICTPMPSDPTPPLPRGLRLAILGGAALAAALAAGATYLLIEGRLAPPRAAVAGPGEIVLQPSRDVGGAFELTDQDGRRVTDADFRGRHMLVFFGFTSCPDVCPMTLQRVADAMASAGLSGERLTPVMISVDPERDAPAALKAYMAAFGPQFVGLTGSPDEIAAVAKSYKAYYKRVEQPDSAMGYLVDHSSFLYLMDAEGRFLTVFDPNEPPDALGAKLKAAIDASSAAGT